MSANYGIRLERRLIRGLIVLEVFAPRSRIWVDMSEDDAKQLVSALELMIAGKTSEERIGLD